jgi:acyl-CoA synthetase (AMP-forming)/AMP-acid ligase II
MTATVIDAGDGLPLTVPALLRAQVAERPDTVLLTCDDTELTYAEADRRSAALARGLLALGAGPGSHVGILHPNGSEFVTAWLAAARIGAVSVPLSTFSTSVELAALLRNADVRVVLTAPSYRSHDYVRALGDAVPGLDLAAAPPVMAESAPVLRHVVFAVGGTADGTRGGAEGLHPGWTAPWLTGRGEAVGDDVLRAAEEAVTPADRMVIVHTSGSTSEPKGVIHAHGALIRHLDNLNQLRRFVPGEVLFSNSPFFWIGGFAYALLGTLVAGATLACSNAADAAGVLDLIERARPTMVNGFAASVAHLPDDPTFAGRDLSSIRRGNLYPIMPPALRPADPELRHGMLGMTETGSVCLLSEDESDQPEHRRGSFGRPAPGFEARVVGEDGGECPPGEPGVLHLRGPFLMEGYYGRERHEVFDPDGWYDTGDLVVVDADGLFYFRGRQGDMIKTAGANVSPREVEAAIRDVAGLTAHVVGVDDVARGQIVAAAVRVPPGRTVAADELRARLGERLSAYKVPRRIVLLADDEVPMMSSGKLDLRALKDLLGAG